MKNEKKSAGAATHTADNQDHNYHSKKPALSQITKETRLESYITRPTRQSEILAVMKKYGDMTARDISYRMGFVDLNAVKPRLSELLRAGKVEVITKKKDRVTGKTVAVYRRKSE